MYYTINRVWNVIFNFPTDYVLDLEMSEDLDVSVVSFADKDEAIDFYDKLVDFLYTCYGDRGINEAEIITFTDSGPYLYVRLQRCELKVLPAVVAEYFRNEEA